jgi:hypothetical protein
MKSDKPVTMPRSLCLGGKNLVLAVAAQSAFLSFFFFFFSGRLSAQVQRNQVG